MKSDAAQSLSPSTRTREDIAGALFLRIGFGASLGKYLFELYIDHCGGMFGLIRLLHAKVVGS